MTFPAGVPVLADGTIRLRAHAPEDVPAILSMCVDADTVRWTSIPSPYTLSDAEWYVREFVPAGWTDRTEYAFAIEVEGDFAGSCSLRVLSDSRGDVGYVVHPDFRGRGVMERALRLLVDWSFEGVGLRTLSWWAHLGNWASRRVAWKLGFSCYGPLDAWLPQRGRLGDCWVGVLRRDDPRSPGHPWYDAPRIVGARVVLRPHVPSDARRIVEACTDERTRRWVRLPSPYTLSSALDFMHSRQELMATGKVVHWAVGDRETDALLGAITLFDVKPGLDAEVGYWAHPDARGRGLITEACRLAVRHGFVPVEDGGLGLGRITASAGVDNAASLHVIHTVGFRRYGIERRGGSNDRGDVFDLVCHDLLAEEFAVTSP